VRRVRRPASGVSGVQRIPLRVNLEARRQPLRVNPL
jgi:hypothetical protein